MTYYYIPQNAWGLVDQAHYDTVGFYSGQGGGCRPVALWSQGAQRGAYTHFDGDTQAVTEALVDWLANGSQANTIAIYTNDDQYGTAIQDQILLSGFYQENLAAKVTVVPDSNPDGEWGCQFGNDGPQWLDTSQEDERSYPEDWSGYWDDAPEWISNGNFINAIADQLKGFIANYNGRFYFDF